MKKSWLILFCASQIFIVLKFLIPRDTILDLFSKNGTNQFEDTLNEQAQDTIDQKRVIDSIAFVEKTRITTLQEKEKKTYDSIQKAIKYKNDTRNGIKGFFKKLYALEQNDKKQVRIAVFGDSMVEGDLIVMQLRHYLQQKFGGKGVGYVPINSLSSRSRNSIKHRYKGPWREYNFMKKGFKRFPFGLNGKTFYVGGDSVTKTASVSFQKGTAYKNLPLINPILFYGRPIDTLGKPATAYYTVKDTTKNVIKLKTNRLLNTYKFPINPYKFNITLKDQRTTPFYGVSFASKNGIIIDNLAVRANSGLPLSKLNTNLMQQFDKHFNYDLIIVAYGTNTFSFKSRKYGWYKARMVKNIKHLQKCFPNADFLVSSMADRSQKINSKMQTPEHLPDFINIQHQIAKESKSGFFNLYEQMGGANSMVEWVKDKSAAKDYTHLSGKGARKAGKLIYNWLIKNYNDVKPELKRNNG